MKTLQMLLWLTSMAFCLVFLLISVMSVMSKHSASSAIDLQILIEPICFALACISLSVTPIRALSHMLRYLLAFGSTLLIGLYYFLIIILGDNYTNHPNSTLFQMDMWIIFTIVLLVSYAVALFKADHAKVVHEDADDSDLLIDPLFKPSSTSKQQASSEEIELEIGGSQVSHSQKRWRRTT